MVIAQNIFNSARILHERAERAAATVESAAVVDVTAGDAEMLIANLMIGSAISRAGSGEEGCADKEGEHGDNEHKVLENFHEQTFL
jgi:hypothetical protein